MRIDVCDWQFPITTELVDSIDAVRLFCALVPASFMMLSIGVSAYIAHRDLDFILGIFKKSYAIIYHGRMQPGDKWSLWSRLSLVSHLSVTLMLAQRYVRNGMIDPEELKRLPDSIRKRMIVCALLVMCSFISMCVSFCILINCGYAS